MSTCLDVNFTDYSDLLHSPPLRTTLTVVWCAVGLLMFAGNLLVVCTVCAHKAMRTVTNCYVLNLAVTDLLAAMLVLPLKGLQLLGPCELAARLFDKTGCAVVTFSLMALVFTSLFTLVVICIERFLAIVHPLRSLLFQSSKRTAIFILLSWAVPSAFCLVQAAHSEPRAFNSVSEFGSSRSQHCMDSFTAAGRFAYVLSAFGLLFLCPLGIVVFTSASIIRVLMRPVPGHHESIQLGARGGTRSGSARGAVAREESKRKVAKMMVVVAALFLVSWSPWFAVNVTGLFYLGIYDQNYSLTMVVLHLVGFVNSTSNPLVYYFMSQRFRQGYRRILRRLFCRGASPGEGGRLSCHSHRRLATEARRLELGLTTSMDNDCATRCDSTVQGAQLSQAFELQAM